ncbi:spindle and centriole-associated protein 1-like [Ptychodera flava]|uniref:spindle and centriole-associated protein 1-like n=1 Tax=Ptychodera flava TaxID=63121 RepID=UPI003969FB65
MSLVRVQALRQNGPTAGKSKKRSKKKAAWDNTNSDLSVHKLSPSELEHRHLIHQSNNLSSVKLEKQQKALMKALRKTPQSEERARVSVLREMLYDGDELQSVLSHTDRVMAVVKDLFGDDPKRYTGLPNVTFAPGQQSNIDRSMLSLSQSTEIPNKNEKPDPPILNELSEESESDDDDDTTLCSSQMKPEKDTSEPTQLSGISDIMMTPEKTHVIPEEETPKGLAINDTIKVRKTKKRTANFDDSSNISTFSDADGLKKVINGLEQEVEEYEQMIGQQNAPKPTKDTGELGGYTSSLLATITKLVQYLKQSEKQFQIEARKHADMEKELQENRELTDALTAELMVTQDQLLGLQTEFQNYRANTESQLNYLKHTVYSVYNRTPDAPFQPQVQPHPQQQQQQEQMPVFQKQGFQPYQPQPKLHPPQPQTIENDIVTADVPTQPDPSTLPRPEFIISNDQNGDLLWTDQGEGQTPNNDSSTELAEQFTAALSTVPAYVKPLQTAVLLSPPRQRDRSTLPKPTGITVHEVSSAPVQVPIASGKVTVVPASAPSDIPAQHSDLTEQIATLTQQRSQAQARLQALQSYRKPLADTGNITSSYDVIMKPNSTSMPGKQSGSVSPAISPIPHENSVPSKTIAVTLPRVEELELSAGSTPSPRQQHGKENRLSDVPITTVSSIASNIGPTSKSQASSEGGFFALSSHMSQ